MSVIISFVRVSVIIFQYILCNYGSSRMTNRTAVGSVWEMHLQKAYVSTEY